MKKTYTLFILLFSIFLVNAQTLVNKAWQDTTGHPTNTNLFQSAKLDASGNLYMAASTYHSGQSDNLLITKYNSSGTKLWQKEYNPSSNHTDILTDFYIKGSYYYCTGTLWDSANNKSTLLVLKGSTSTGDTTWTRYYNGTYGGYDAGGTIKVDVNDNVYVGGTDQQSSTNFRMMALKYNSSGTQQWVAFYDSSGYYDGAVDMTIATTTGIVTSVTMVGFSGSGFANWDFMTVAFNPTTGALGRTQRSANANGGFSQPTGIIKDDSDKIYIAGTSVITGTNNDIKIIKYDTLLNQVWLKKWGNADSLKDESAAITRDVKQNILITGFTTRPNGAKDLLILKYNTVGTLLWSRTVSAPDTTKDCTGKDIFADDSSNVYVTGSVNNGTDNDFITLCYDKNGNLKWQINYAGGTASNDQAFDVIVDTLHNVYVSGNSKLASTGYVTLCYQQKTAFIPSDSLNANTAYALYENRGQITINDSTSADSVLYYTNAGNPQLYISDKRISYVIGHISNDSIPVTDTVCRIDMSLAGSGLAAYSKIQTFPHSKTNAFLNYFLGYLPASITRVEGYNRIIRKDVYKGVDLEVCSDTGGIKNYFVVYPNEVGTPIRIKYNGADSIRITNKKMKLYTRIGNIQFDSLVAYQIDASGTKSSVTISYDSTGVNEFKFIIGSYTAGNYLVVEQRLGASRSTNVNSCWWSTYFGGWVPDQAQDVKTDANNNVYMTGLTYSKNFPLTTGSIPFTTFDHVGYLAKFDINAVLQYSTYFGDHDETSPKALAINSAGEVFVCGYHLGTADFPAVLASPAYQPSATLTHPGEASFIARFNPANGSITWASPYAGLQNNIYFYNDNLYMIGKLGYQVASNPDFTNVNSTTCTTGCLNNTAGEGCVSKFNSSLQLAWATRFGSTTVNMTELRGITTALTNIYMVGNSVSVSSTAFPIVGTGYSQSYGGGVSDGIIMKFDANDNLIYSTYYGGSGADELGAITTHYYSDAPDYRVYTCGTTSAAFTQADQTGSAHYKGTFGTNSGQNEGILLGLNSDNTRYYATYYGCDGITEPQDITCYHDEVYVTGQVNDNGIPIETPTGYFTQAANAHVPKNDGFIARFMNGIALDWSTFIGGSEDDIPSAIAHDNNDKLYIVGYTFSPQTSTPGDGYPLFNPGNGAYYQSTLNPNPTGPPHTGLEDAFITRLCVTGTVTHVSDVASKEGIIIYPNPASNSITIVQNDLLIRIGSVEIINPLGQKIFQSDYVKSEIDISTLSQGMYILRLKCDGVYKAVKFIKE